ncbi:MAG: hypothetical protein ACI892_002465, partial [Marinobacter maritimus]
MVITGVNKIGYFLILNMPSVSEQHRGEIIQGLQ